jgi:hypothetical protein
MDQLERSLQLRNELLEEQLKGLRSPWWQSWAVWGGIASLLTACAATIGLMWTFNSGILDDALRQQRLNRSLIEYDIMKLELKKDKLNQVNDSLADLIAFQTEVLGDKENALVTLKRTSASDFERFQHIVTLKNIKIDSLQNLMHSNSTIVMDSLMKEVRGQIQLLCNEYGKGGESALERYAYSFLNCKRTYMDLMFWKHQLDNCTQERARLELLRR